MPYCDTIGYLASALVLGAFAMKNMVQLRIVAICSNIAFIAYGVALGLIPVLVLHVILLPMNGWRLWQVLHMRSDPSETNACRAYQMKLPMRLAPLAMRLAAVIGSLAATTAVAGWLIVTGAESNAGDLELRPLGVKHSNSPSVPGLIPMW
ncbi:MAG TPA: hypothetical protein VH678_03405 [Xanthobacteraceae bacterium]|jgi:hypothetical protein